MGSQNKRFHSAFTSIMQNTINGVYLIIELGIIYVTDIYLQKWRVRACIRNARNVSIHDEGINTFRLILTLLIYMVRDKCEIKVSLVNDRCAFISEES